MRTEVRRMMLGALATLLAACGDGRSAVPATPAAMAAPVRPTMDAGPPAEVRAACVLQPRRLVKLKSQVGGEITAVTAQVGQRVRAGEVLAQLRNKEYQFELDRVLIGLQEARERQHLNQLQTRRAESDWEAVRGLYSAQARQSGKEAVALEERRSEGRLIELQAQDLQLQADKLRETIGQTFIRAPMDGMVISRNAEPGLVVGSAVTGIGGLDVLFEVGDPLWLRAECFAREIDAHLIHPGEPIELALDGRAEIALRATVDRVSPALNHDAGVSRLAFSAELHVDPHARVMPGMRATGAVQVRP